LRDEGGKREACSSELLTVRGLKNSQRYKKEPRCLPDRTGQLRNIKGIGNRVGNTNSDHRLTGEELSKGDTTFKGWGT